MHFPHIAMSLLLKRPCSSSRSEDRSCPPELLAFGPESRAQPTITLMWADKHSPTTSAELAMHKKKVDEIRQWLRLADASLQLGLPPTPRMLVLSGPPGSGKSSMIRVLSHELGFEVCEWIEPRTQQWQTEAAHLDHNEQSFSGSPGCANQGYESRVAQFESFLHTSLRTLSLCCSGTGQTASGQTASTRRRLVLLDELAPAVGGDGSSPLRRQQAPWSPDHALHSAVTSRRHTLSCLLAP